jgi:hypothetical protein
MGAILNGLGAKDESIEDPGSPGTPDHYQFNGVATQNIAQDGFIQIGSSESDLVQTYPTEQTVTDTYQVPVYGTRSQPAAQWFESVNDPAADVQDFSADPGADPNNPDPEFETPVYSSGGQLEGWNFHFPTQSETVQTGTRTVTRTYTIQSEGRNETRGFTDYNIQLGNADDTLEATAPFVGTVNMGNGNDFVDLGLEDSPDVKGIFGFPTYYAGELSPGAFIEAGDGNDTI